MFNRDIQIKDKYTALKAIELITEQGEGGISVPESHYTVFVDLYHRPESWVCYDVIKDPKSAEYPAGAAKEVKRSSHSSENLIPTHMVILACPRFQCVLLLPSPHHREGLDGT